MTNQFSYVRGNTRHDLLLFPGTRFPDTSWKMRGIAVELSGGKDARAHGRTPGIGALTRTALATSTHADSVVRGAGRWQVDQTAVGLRRQMVAFKMEANVTHPQ